MKLIKKLLIRTLLLIIIVCSLIFAQGYYIYNNAVSKISIEDKVNKIKSDKNYLYLSDIPLDYQNAVIAVEDHRFKTHKGIDFISIGRAIVRDIQEMALVEGGSTLTQQLAKNMYFTQEKKFTRKVSEVLVALQLEKTYSKDEILELYINTAYFGEGCYGIKEASQEYFEKAPSELTLEECALLAGVPNAPSIYSPKKNPNLAKERQEKVLSAMYDYGYINSQV